MPARQVHCLHTGKVFCEFCAKPSYRVPLPQHERRPDQATPVQVPTHPPTPVITYFIK